MEWENDGQYLCFRVLGKSVYNAILGWAFLKTLYVVASTVHLKLKYYDDFGKLIEIKEDLYKAHLIQEAVLNKFIVVVITPENSIREASITGLNPRKEELP